jgi:hypothetical protein
MATAQDFLDSMEAAVDCNIRRESGCLTLWQTAAVLTTHTGGGLPCLLQCAKVRVGPVYGNFVLELAQISKLTRPLPSIASTAVTALCTIRADLI